MKYVHLVVLRVIPFSHCSTGKLNKCAKLLSDLSNTNRHIQMLSFSLMEQKMRGNCITPLPPSRVLHFPPSALSEICDVPPSITTDSHLAWMLLLKL